VDDGVRELNRRLGLPGDLTRLDVGPAPARPTGVIGLSSDRTPLDINPEPPRPMSGIGLPLPPPRGW
jgi:hypothetical protein